MEDLITIFIDTYYSDEFKQEVERSFGLFEFFEYNQAFQPFVDILMNESNLDQASMNDMFVQKLHEGLNYILQEHQIKLIDVATIHEKNEILLALAHVQNLVDYTPVIRTLETFEPDEIQLSSILADISMLDQFKIMELIESFNPGILQTLKNFIYEKEKDTTAEELTNPKLIKHLRLFASVFGETPLGVQMARGQLRIGERFETYIDFIQDGILSPDEKQTALNILSVIFLSSDGFNSPLLVYRKYSYQLLQDLNLVSRVEIHLLNHISELTAHQKAAEEKASRTNQTVHIN